jgi:prevent-host-death family protein
MKSFSVSEASAKLEALMAAVEGSHQPILVTSEHGDSVLVSEDHWRGIQETLYLLSIPGMRDSIRKGRMEPLRKASSDPGW